MGVVCVEPSRDEQDYVAYERGALAMLATRYHEIDPDDRRELYQEAWASVLSGQRLKLR